MKAVRSDRKGRNNVAQSIALASILTLIVASSAALADERLVIHEWGTFTSLQDEDGRAIAGINGDDEPVPSFVHRAARLLLLSPRASIPVLYQGAPRCHPHVTMRLETPVVYFYPPQSISAPMKVDFRAAFRGGWLTEYYPDAKVRAPGIQSDLSFGALTADTVGELTWEGLTVGGAGKGPETDENVWLAPRRVDAASVTATNGETEQFLFYRGVGHIDAPLRVVRDAAGEKLLIYTQLDSTFPRSKPLRLARLWIVDIRKDGSSAHQTLGPFNLAREHGRVVCTAPAAFSARSYSLQNLQQLRQSMMKELMRSGLFRDEADALLNTWELSYFKSPGFRVFFIVPRSWTDHILPIDVSVPADITRVMVGRIELVTPTQRALLHKIAAGPVSKIDWALDNRQRSVDERLAPPADFQAYDELGRFCNALLLDEVKRRPTEALKQFIKNYGLHAYTPREEQ